MNITSGSVTDFPSVSRTACGVVTGTSGIGVLQLSGNHVVCSRGTSSADLPVPFLSIECSILGKELHSVCGGGRRGLLGERGGP